MGEVVNGKLKTNLETGKKAFMDVRIEVFDTEKRLECDLPADTKITAELINGKWVILSFECE